MTALESLHQKLVDLYPHLTNDRDSLLLNPNGTMTLHTKKITLLCYRLHPLTPEEHTCLRPLLQRYKVKKPELNGVIRKLGIDIMLEQLNTDVSSPIYTLAHQTNHTV